MAPLVAALPLGPKLMPSGAFPPMLSNATPRRRR
jgi:hypothetical protein